MLPIAVLWIGVAAEPFRSSSPFPILQLLEELGHRPGIVTVVIEDLGTDQVSLPLGIARVLQKNRIDRKPRADLRQDATDRVTSHDSAQDAERHLIRVGLSSLDWFRVAAPRGRFRAP